MVQVCNVFAGYSKTPVIHDISFSAKKGTITAIIGPNGCGKSTLIRCIARQTQPLSGTVTILGRPIQSEPPREFAKAVSYLPQGIGVPSLTAEALVLHGRYPHLDFSKRLSEHDYAAAERAMVQTGVWGLREKLLSALSGGERQRVYLAMALAQETDVIILDEPTTFLDINHQWELLRLLYFLRDNGKTILAVLHDLNHVVQIADQVILLNAGGHAVFAGTPKDLIVSDAIEMVFQVAARTVCVDNTPWLIVKGKSQG